MTTEQATTRSSEPQKRQRGHFKRESDALFSKAKKKGTAESWWLQPMSREEFDRVAAERTQEG